jgi:hypothetical protein
MSQRFDIYDLRDACAHVRSVAMVGNAAAILQRQNGALIDSHDLVVRFNRAHVAGIEDRIGSRTDLLVANAANSLQKAPSPADTVKPRWVLCFVQPQPDSNIESFRQWVGNIPTVITLSPDILEFATTGRTRGLTLGTYTPYTLLKRFPLERLFVTGFTMYGAAGGDSHKYYDLARAPAAITTWTRKPACSVRSWPRFSPSCRSHPRSPTSSKGMVTLDGSRTLTPPRAPTRRRCTIACSAASPGGCSGWVSSCGAGSSRAPRSSSTA